ncbi:MAG TPA: hypothetical protein VGF97_14145 [Rhizomicrobium sp.]|jgi:hypothetical protein
MAEHVLTVLRAKRTEIAGQVHDTEKKLTKLRVALANLDAAMAILTPDHPDYIPGRRKHMRTAYFSRKELPRLVRDAMRQAGKPLTATEIAAHAIAAKGLPASAHAATVASVATVLNLGARRGEFQRVGTTKGARWTLSGGSD